MIRVGIDIITVMTILGHSDVKQTLQYCHAAATSKCDAIEKLSRIYFKRTPVADAPTVATQPDHLTKGMVS